MLANHNSRNVERKQMDYKDRLYDIYRYFGKEYTKLSQMGVEYPFDIKYGLKQDFRTATLETSFNLHGKEYPRNGEYNGRYFQCQYFERLQGIYKAFKQMNYPVIDIFIPGMRIYATLSIEWSSSIHSSIVETQIENLIGVMDCKYWLGGRQFEIEYYPKTQQIVVSTLNPFLSPKYIQSYFENKFHRLARPRSLLFRITNVMLENKFLNEFDSCFDFRCKAFVVMCSKSKYEEFIHVWRRTYEDYKKSSTAQLNRHLYDKRSRYRNNYSRNRNKNGEFNANKPKIDFMVKNGNISIPCEIYKVVDFHQIAKPSFHYCHVFGKRAHKWVEVITANGIVYRPLSKPIVLDIDKQQVLSRNINKIPNKYESQTAAKKSRIEQIDKTIESLLNEKKQLTQNTEQTEQIAIECQNKLNISQNVTKKCLELIESHQFRVQLDNFEKDWSKWDHEHILVWFKTILTKKSTEFDEDEKNEQLNHDIDGQVVATPGGDMVENDDKKNISDGNSNYNAYVDWSLILLNLKRLEWDGDHLLICKEKHLVKLGFNNNENARKHLLFNIKRITKKYPSKSSPPKKGKSENGICCICLSNKINAICIPCGHACMCKKCSNDYDKNDACPICRKNIQNVFDMFIS